MWLVFLGLAALVVFLVLRFKKKFKSLSPLGTITVCTGAVKTGKTTLAVHLALKSYKKACFAHKIRALFDKKAEKPLLYSNIPLAVPYVPVTTDMLLRKVRIVSKSVVLLDEASLVADSQLIKDNVINTQLLKFFKLFGHSSHGGSLIVDTQSISDLHFAIKRCIANYCYIQRTYRFLPFFLCMDVIEQRYSDDGTVISNQTDDVDNNLRRVLVPKSVWKKFDTYCYSILTDSLPMYKKEVVADTLKTVKIPSFRDWGDIK